MPFTDSLNVVGQALEDLLKGQVNQGLLQVRKVWFGDEDELIPETPAINVSPEIKTRELYGTGHTTKNNFRFYVTIYHSKLGDPAVTRKECITYSEQVESILHSNRQLGGLLVDSMVESLQPGVSSRNNVIMKATRLTWVGLSSSRL